MADPALVPRAEAAVELLRMNPELEGDLILSYTVWPTAALLEHEIAPRRRSVDAAELAQMRRLADEGLSHYAIAARLGRPRTTVSFALRRAA